MKEKTMEFDLKNAELNELKNELMRCKNNFEKY